MTVSYRRDATFAALPMRQVRDLLDGWSRGGTVAAAAARGKVGLAPSTAAALMDEALAQGLVAEGDDPAFAETDTPRAALLRRWTGGRSGGPRLTVGGIAVATSTITSPIPRAKALGVLGSLLDNAEALNATPGMPLKVERVWSYGSLAKGADSVNDVDVVVETSRTPTWNLDDDTPDGRRWIDLALELGGEATLNGLGSHATRALSYLERRLVTGPRRNPRLAINDLMTLKALACECRLVFDLSRGGRVDDPLLPSHPESGGPRGGIFERLSKPDLAHVTALRPVDARFVDGHVSGSSFADVWARTSQGVSFHHPEVVLGRSSRTESGTTVDEFEIRVSGLRSRWTISRTIGRTDEPDGYRYVLDVEHARRDRGTASDAAAASYLADLVRADLERVGMHALTTGGPRHVTVRASDGMRHPRAEAALSILRETMSDTGFLGPLASASLDVSFENASLPIEATRVTDLTDSGHRLGAGLTL